MTFDDDTPVTCTFVRALEMDKKRARILRAREMDVTLEAFFFPSFFGGTGRRRRNKFAGKLRTRILSEGLSFERALEHLP